MIRCDPPFTRHVGDYPAHSESICPMTHTPLLAEADVPRLIARDGPLVVLHKPAGFAVHPTASPDIPDLMTWAHNTPELAGLAPAHRLDRETSGIVLASTDRATRAALGEWFAAGEIAKRYLVLVHGRIRRKGVIRRPLPDARRGRPLEAVTRYRLVRWIGLTSLVVARPATGRKHQIRRHLQAIGHAVVGDTRYPARPFRPVPGFPGRLWMHAESLALPDGRVFEDPLAPELARHLQLLEAALDVAPAEAAE